MKRLIWIIASIMVVAGILAVSTITYRSSATLPMIGRAMMPDRYSYPNYYAVALGNKIRIYNLTDRLNPTLVREDEYPQAVGPISDIWTYTAWDGLQLSGKFWSGNYNYYIIMGYIMGGSGLWTWGNSAYYIPNGFESSGRTTGNVYGMATSRYRSGQNESYWWVAMHDSSNGYCYVLCYNPNASSYYYVSARGLPFPGSSSECQINSYHKPYPTDMCQNEANWWGPVYICGFYNNSTTADTGWVRGYTCYNGSNTYSIDYYGSLITIIGGKAWGIKRYQRGADGRLYLFVAAGKKGLQIYMITGEPQNSNPSYNTSPSGSWAPIDETALDARDVYVGSDYFAFLANWGTTDSQPLVYALDISNLSSITKIAQANGKYGRKIWVDMDRWITVLSDQFVPPSP